MKNLGFAGGVAFLTLALAACGDDTGGTGTGSGGSTSSSTTAASTTGASGTTTGGSTTSASSTSTGEGAGPGTGGDSPAGTGGDSPAGTGGDSPAGTGGDSPAGTGGAGGGESSVFLADCLGGEIAATITNDGFTGFDPSDTTISTNEIVEFAPDGPHTFTSDDGLFDSSSGVRTCFRFTAAGEFPFHCSNHSAMQGTVTVE